MRNSAEGKSDARPMYGYRGGYLFAFVDEQSMGASTGIGGDPGEQSCSVRLLRPGTILRHAEH
jgi:hypothetical protein